jgi:hypothetical protein
MALTFITEPSSPTPAYNDSWFVVSSNQTGQTGFKYVVTATVGSTTKTWNIAPAPDGKLYFNVRDYVINFIQRAVDFDSVSVQLITNKIITASIDFKEYYSGTVQSTVNKSKKFWDACYYNELFDAYDYTTWFDEQVQNFWNADNRVTLNQPVWLHFSEYNWDTIEVFYNTVSLGNPTNPSPYDDKKIYALNIGSELITALGETPAIGGVVDIALNYDGNPYETISYTIQNICSKYPIKTIYFLKRNGQIAFKHFELVSSKSLDKVTNTVRQSRGVTYDTWDREKFITSTQTTKQVVLNSNWITESQSDALQELFDSPVVWLLEQSNLYRQGYAYYPVSITDKNYNVKTHKVDKAFNYTITCEYDIKETRQRGI